MKKEFLALFLLALFITPLVSAQLSIQTDQVIINAGNTKVDQAVHNAYQNSAIFGAFTFYILGIKDLSDKDMGNYGAASIILIFFLIWLMLFVTFSDILAGFGAFSNAVVAWMVGFAIVTIAANLKLIQIIALWMIAFTALFGTLAVFFGIFMAFVAFIAISYGGNKFSRWALDRKAGIAAHQGRSEMVEGIATLRGAGRGTLNNGNNGNELPWWVPLAVAGGIILVGIIFILVYNGLNP